MLDREHNECILACNACLIACLQCASACLADSDPKAMARCIRLAVECADVCRLTAASIAWGGEHMNAVSSLCAAVCQTCGSECASHPMERCQKCAEACKHCAAVCRGMA